MKISLLVVNYRSADLTVASIESARRATGFPVQAVVVDNSCEPEEMARIGEGSADVVISAPGNLGYAGGINRGLPSCTGDVVIVSNPDVVFSRGSIDALIEPLNTDELAMTGPSFFWDSDLRWHLPPAQIMSFPDQLSRNLARRIPVLREKLSAHVLRRRAGIWQARSPVELPVVSGAVMAMRSEQWRGLGMDERYPLYFEEVDLMRRLRRAGGKVLYVPTARVEHMWAQSSARNPESAAMFDRSKALFNRRWFGRAGTAILSATESTRRQVSRSPRAGQPEKLLPGEYLIEVGDTEDFLMAAGCFSSSPETSLPRGPMARSPLDEFHVRVVSMRDWRVVRQWRVEAGGKRISPDGMNGTAHPAQID